MMVSEAVNTVYSGDAMEGGGQWAAKVAPAAITIKNNYI